MLNFSTFKNLILEQIDSFPKKLSRIDAINIAKQQAKLKKIPHYAKEHPDGWSVHDTNPASNFSMNRIIKLHPSGKHEII